MLDHIFKLKFLEGNRTKIAAILVSLLTLSLNLGWITQEQFNAIFGFLTSIGLLAAASHQNAPKP